MKKLLNHFEEYVSCIIFVVMLGLTFLNVIFRNFATSISFTEEITTSLFVPLCMLGTAIAARENSHLGLSILTEFLSMKNRLRFAFIANVLGFVFSAVLLCTGMDMVYIEYKMNQISIALQWPQWIYGSFFALGAFFMTIRFAQAAVFNIQGVMEADK